MGTEGCGGLQRIIAYARAMSAGDQAPADEQRRFACVEPHPGIFRWIVHWADVGDPGGYLDPRCVAAVAAHPEIRSWCG